MTPQELKNSILQLAVQGKLVPQRLEEGSAEELLVAISAQKQSSDSRSAVRKKKNSHKDTQTQSDIPDDEIPFEIPKTWKWVPFGFFMELRMGKTILKSELGMQGVPVYSATQDDSVLGYIENPELELHKNDLVIPARGNSIGCVTLVTDNLATCTQTTICGRNIHSVDVRYIYYCCWAFKSVWFKYVGSAIPQVTVTQIEKCMVPLPPLAEQKRIVAKLEELLPLCDRYGNAYNELQALNKRVPGDLQKSLLQLAVQGKLVPQRPEEGSAEELLAAIRAQKQSSDSRSAVRKKKNSHKDTQTQSDIPDDEIPFEIPKTWKWVRLGEMVEIYTGKKDANAGAPTGEYDFFTCSNQPIKSETYSYDGEFLIMPGNGANIGMVIHYSGKFEAYQRTYLLENKYGIFMKYLKYHLESNWKQYNANKMYGSAIPYIKLGNLTNYLVALPPLAEQKRIVAKIEELIPLCDQLSHL